MLFSSPEFLFLFLPVVLGLYFVVRTGLRNLLLLVASLFFYAYGEKAIVLIMLASIAANWCFGLMVERTRERPSAKLVIALAVVFNLGLLIFWKYANFLWDQVGALCTATGLAESWPRIQVIHLPIGISFFTFQAMCYVIDVYRREGPVQRNPINFAVYIALFPQLIAGPIVRYRDIAAQLLNRVVDREGFAYGARRFVIGLGKKMLVANVVAETADGIFGTAAQAGLAAEQMSPAVAWLGLVCYTLQIYFDFSAYSDMAIGLGRMLGFRFLENFRFPYVATSITDFWRRWHISLSTWFRDYLYIPLGGSRKSRLTTLRNLVIVFFLCGLWHGAAWSFVVWGLFHGVFLVIERLGLKALIERLRVVRHVYVMLVAMVGWVFFRALTLGQAVEYLRVMVGLGPVEEGVAREHLALFLDPLLATVILVGCVFSTPLLPRLTEAFVALRRREPAPRLGFLVWGSLALLVALGLLSAMQLASSSYNPFIYFRF